MKELPKFNVSAIPATRKVRSDTDLRQFVVKDQKTLEAAARTWVRQTARRALGEVLNAGNPEDYITQIDGTTGASGSAKAGKGFHEGTIESAERSVRVTFVADDLALVAQSLKPILERAIMEAFPMSSGRLRNSWSWWIQRNALLAPKNTVAARKLGKFVHSRDVTIYDVLWLAPDGGDKNAAANYAFFVNMKARRSKLNAAKEAALQKSVDNVLNGKRKRGRAAKPTTRQRGFFGEATHRMRGRGRNNYRGGGINVQGWFVKQHLTGPGSRSRKYGVPVVRVAYMRGLRRPAGVNV